jgi:hypothetical protein
LKYLSRELQRIICVEAAIIKTSAPLDRERDYIDPAAAPARKEIKIRITIDFILGA